jgi:hypothetical protein
MALADVKKRSRAALMEERPRCPALRWNMEEFKVSSSTFKVEGRRGSRYTDFEL